MSLGGGQQQGAPQLQSSNTNSNTQTNMGPWIYQQPFLNQGYLNASGLLAGNSQPLQQNQWLSQSLQDMVNAAAPSNQPQSFKQAGNYYSDVLSGKYMSPTSNPYLASMEQAAADPVIRQYMTATAPQTGSAMETANRYGSGASRQLIGQNQQALGQTLRDLANQFYGGAYNTGISQMQGAAAAQPGYLASSFLPSQIENQAGQQQQAFMQAQQMYPWLTNQMYQQIVGTGTGQSGTSSSQGTMTGQMQQPYYSNPAGSIFGGALAGLGTLGNLGWSPFAAGGAAGAGEGIAGLIGGAGSLLPMIGI